jgi:hypothetical protein
MRGVLLCSSTQKMQRLYKELEVRSYVEVTTSFHLSKFHFADIQLDIAINHIHRLVNFSVDVRTNIARAIGSQFLLS